MSRKALDIPNMNFSWDRLKAVLFDLSDDEAQLIKGLYKFEITPRPSKKLVERTYVLHLLILNEISAVESLVMMQSLRFRVDHYYWFVQGCALSRKCDAAATVISDELFAKLEKDEEVPFCKRKWWRLQAAKYSDFS